MIQNVIFGILLLKILFWAYVFIFVQTFPRTSSEFLFQFRFSSRKSQSQEKLAKEITNFTIQKTLLILQTSTHSTLQIACSRNRVKNISNFKDFPAEMFLLGVRENICTAIFLDAQELHCWSTLKANVYIFLYISVRKFLFQRCNNILSNGGGLGEG